MRSLIDTIFSPLLDWLSSVRGTLSDLSVPAARPLNLGQYFGYFNALGPYWLTFITTACLLAFIYGVTYVLVNQVGLIQKFKNLIKWW